MQVNKLTIEGNNRTRKELIEEEFKAIFHTNDVQKIINIVNNVQNKLMSTGAFEFININDTKGV